MANKTDEVMEELLGLEYKEMVEILSSMTKGDPVRIGGNVYMLPTSFSIFLEQYIRYLLGIDGIPRNKKN